MRTPETRRPPWEATLVRGRPVERRFARSEPLSAERRAANVTHREPVGIRAAVTPGATMYGPDGIRGSWGSRWPLLRGCSVPWASRQNAGHNGVLLLVE